MPSNHTATAEEIAQHLGIGLATFRKYRTEDKKALGREPVSFERLDRVVYFDPAECQEWLKLRDFRGERPAQLATPKAKASKSDRSRARRNDPVPVLKPCNVCRTIPVGPWYQINIETGEVRNAATGKTLKSYVNKDNYLQVTLTLRNGSKGLLVHRLVALAVHGNPANQRQCASHLDGNRLNNHHSNLLFKSSLENARDRDTHDTTACGASNGNSKLTEDGAWRAYFMFHVKKMSTREIGAELGISYKTVQQIVSHKTWVKSNFAQTLAKYLETEAQAEAVHPTETTVQPYNPFLDAEAEMKLAQASTADDQPILVNWFTINAEEMIAQLDQDEDAAESLIPAASVITATAATTTIRTKPRRIF